MFSLKKIIDKLFSDRTGTFQYENINDPMTMTTEELLFELNLARQEQRKKEKEKERDELVEKIANRVIEKLKEEGLCKGPGYTATSGPI